MPDAIRLFGNWYPADFEIFIAIGVYE